MNGALPDACDIQEGHHSPSLFGNPFLFLSIFAGHAAAALIYDALPPILVTLAAHFGGGEQGRRVAELASTLPFFGVILGGLVAGPMIERVGINRVLPFMLLLFALSGSSGLLLDSATALLGLRVVMGMSIGVMLTCCTVLIALGYHGAARARMNGILFGVGALFGVCLLIVSGYVAEEFGWRAPFALHAVVAAMFIVPALLLGRVEHVPIRHAHFAANMRRLKVVVLPCLLAAALFIMGFLYNVQMAFLMTESGIGEPHTIARVFSVQAVTVMIVSPLYGRFAHRFSLRGSLQLAFALHVFALIIGGLSDNVPLFVLTLMCGGCGTAIALPAIWSWVMRITPPDLVGRALGLVTMSLYLGGTISPIVLTPLRLMLGLREQFFAAAAAIFAVLAIAVVAGMLKSQADGKREVQS